MNIIHKLGSLIRRKRPFFSLSYCWRNNNVIIFQTQDAYFNDLLALKESAVMKRVQCYVPQLITIANDNYAIYMVSYGDIRPNKFIYGQNPISLAFGICLFDYVYLFLEDQKMAAKKITFRMQILKQQGRFNEFFKMNKTGEILFGGKKQFCGTTIEISKKKKIHKFRQSQQKTKKLKMFYHERKTK